MRGVWGLAAVRLEARRQEVFRRLEAGLPLDDKLQSKYEYWAGYLHALSVIRQDLEDVEKKEADR